MCTVWYLVGISLLIWLKPPDMSWSSDLFWSLCWFQFPRHLPNWMIWHLIWSWKRRWKYRIDLKNSGWVIYNLSWLLPHPEWPIFHKHPGWWGVFGNDFPNIWFVCKAFSGWNLKITFFGKEIILFQNHLIPNLHFLNGSIWVFSKYVAASSGGRDFFVATSWIGKLTRTVKGVGISLSPEPLRRKQQDRKILCYSENSWNKLGGGFKHVFIITPTWRNDPIWLYVSTGLKPSSRKHLECNIASIIYVC